MSTEAKTTTKPEPVLIVVSATTGDIFRVFADGRAVELDEPMLADPGEIATMQPTRQATAKLRSAEQGDEFWPCPRIRCSECNGSGWLSSGENNPHGFPEHACARCYGEGGSYFLAAAWVPSIRRAELPFDAAAVAAFAPLRLEDEASAVVDLRGAA